MANRNALTAPEGLAPDEYEQWGLDDEWERRIPHPQTRENYRGMKETMALSRGLRKYYNSPEGERDEDEGRSIKNRLKPGMSSPEAINAEINNINAEINNINERDADLADYSRWLKQVGPSAGPYPGRGRW